MNNPLIHIPTIHDVSNYWNARPCNIKHSTKPVGTKEYFDEVEKRKYLVEPHILDFAEFHRWKGKKVLEIGSGIGTDSINFSRAGALLTVTELSEESLKVCKKRFDEYGLPARLFTGNAEILSSFVPVEKYDLIYSFGVIHHTPNPKKVIDEIKKYMDQDSELRIMLYSKYSIKNLMIRLKLWQPEAQNDCPIAFVYSSKDIRNLLNEFEIVSLKKEHIFPYRISDYVNHKYKKAFPWNIMPHFLFHRIEKALGWHWLIIAKVKHTSI